MIVVDS